MLLYGSEAFYYYTAPVNFYTCFPLGIALLTIVCLLIAPIFLQPAIKRQPIVTDVDDDEEEDYELLAKQRHNLIIPPSLPAKIKKNQ